MFHEILTLNLVILAIFEENLSFTWPFSIFEELAFLKLLWPNLTFLIFLDQETLALKQCQNKI